MSEDDLATVQRLSEAFNAGDFERALAFYDEAAELDVTRMPGGGIYRGREGVREFYRGWVRSWDRFESTPLEFIDTGDSVVMLTHLTGVGRDSGARVTMRPADVFFLEDGKIVRHVGYPDASE